MYTPICQDNYDLSIMPCQEVCIEAKKQCAPLMLSHGFQWPDTLNCDQLPKFSDQQQTGNICAAPPDATQISEEQPKLKPDLSRNRVNDQSTNVGRVTNNNKQCNCQCTAPFRLISSESTAISTKSYQVQNVSNCAYSCDGLLMPPTKSERNFLNQWMLIL